MKSELSREFKFKVMELRKIIKSWDLIPGSPANEFDTLNLKLLSHLEEGTEREKIERFIYSELISHYGLDIKETDAEQFASEVLDWWSSRN